MKIFNKLEEWIGGALFLVIFCILVLQILFRQAFHSPLIWSEELAKLLFVYVGMLGISVAVRKQEHVYIDFLTNLMPPAVKKITNTFVQIVIFLGVIFFIHFGIKTYLGANFPIDALGGISEKWIYASLPIIAVLMLVRFFQAQADNFKENKSYLPATFFIVSAVVLLGILFLAPDWYEVFRVTDYVKLGANAVYVALLFWLVIMFLGVPVGWSLFITTLLYFSMTRWNVVNAASDKLTMSLNSFPLLAVPFYILTGILMNTGGITERIFNFAKALLGHYTGGMGHVNIGASLLFSGM